MEARLLEKDNRRRVNKADLILAANGKNTNNNGLNNQSFGFLKRSFIISEMNLKF